MIELNLTYEESKKILELGYDFSKICTKFELHQDKEIKVCYGEKVSRETIRNQYTLIDDNPWFQGKAWVEDFIAIIPKAALEACLPDYSFTDAAKRKLSCRWYGHIPICNEAYALNDIHLHHKSAYEAFIWCHENYPEELKKKFDEVMG